jgi:hypothetical protein
LPRNSIPGRAPFAGGESHGPRIARCGVSPEPAARVFEIIEGSTQIQLITIPLFDFQEL